VNKLPVRGSHAVKRPTQTKIGESRENHLHVRIAQIGDERSVEAKNRANASTNRMALNGRWRRLR